MLKTPDYQSYENFELIIFIKWERSIKVANNNNKSKVEEKPHNTKGDQETIRSKLKVIIKSISQKRQITIDNIKEIII